MPWSRAILGGVLQILCCSEIDSAALPLGSSEAPLQRQIAVQSLSLVDTLQPHGLQHTRLPCLPLSSGASSDSCPLSR